MVGPSDGKCFTLTHTHSKCTKLCRNYIYIQQIYVLAWIEHQTSTFAMSPNLCILVYLFISCVLMFWSQLYRSRIGFEIECFNPDFATSHKR